MDRYTFLAVIRKGSLSFSLSSSSSLRFPTTKVAFVVPTSCPPSIYIYEIRLISVHRFVLEKKGKGIISSRNSGRSSIRLETTRFFSIEAFDGHGNTEPILIAVQLFRLG